MLVAMKFGGGILSTAEDFKRVAEIVRKRREKGEEIAIAVSAIKGMTDELIDAAKGAVKNSRGIDGFIRHAKESHSKALEGIKDTGIKEAAANEIAVKIGLLEKALYGVSYLKELSPRSYDLLQTFGERIAIELLEAYLLDNGVNAKALEADEAGMIVDSNYGRASPKMDEVERQMKQKVEPLLKTTVAIIPGFYGVNKHNDIVCFGRGGTDYTAGIIAAALDADHLELWKDVDGFMSADPKAVKNAKLIAQLSYDEAEELGYFGAKIMHPRTVMPLRGKKIPIQARNVLKPEKIGTTICAEGKCDSEKVIKSIVSRKDIAMVSIKSAELIEGIGMIAKIFSTIAEAGISVDMVSTSEAGISLTVEKKNAQKTRDVLAKELDFEVEKIIIEDDIVLTSVIGHGMKGTPGIAGKLFSAMGKAGINIEVISQASEINISFIIKEKNTEKAIAAIHREFME
ncbi:MAG: aspartate kinase [Candidatus Diapherotrites archaeon]